VRLFRRKSPRLTREQTLAAIPVRNQNMEVATDDAGNVTVTLPWRRSRRASVVATLLMVPPGKRRRVVELDEVGSFVFGLCDGARPVKTIVDIFAERYRLSRKEAAVSIVAYLGQLARRGMIALMVPSGPAARAARSGSRRRGSR
jgi:hypothetical protein